MEDYWTIWLRVVSFSSDKVLWKSYLLPAQPPASFLEGSLLLLCMPRTRIPNCVSRERNKPSTWSYPMLRYLARSEHHVCRGCDFHMYERWARACNGDNPGEWGMQSLSSCRERVAKPKRRSQDHSLSSVLLYPAEDVLGKQCGMPLLSGVLGCGSGGQLQTQVFKHMLMRRKYSPKCRMVSFTRIFMQVLWFFNHSSQAHCLYPSPFLPFKNITHSLAPHLSSEQKACDLPTPTHATEQVPIKKSNFSVVLIFTGLVSWWQEIITWMDKRHRNTQEKLMMNHSLKGESCLSACICQAWDWHSFTWLTQICFV